jgi:hypothetical protein
MSKSAPSGRAKRSRSAAGTTTTTQQPAPPTDMTTPSISADQRHTMIAETAYLKAAARGFSGGDPVADWLASERDVDALLSNGHELSRNAQDVRNSR